MKNIAWGALLILGSAVLGCSETDIQAAPAATETAPMQKPAASETIHERVFTLDTHVDIPLDFATDAIDPLHRENAQFDLARMLEGGLDAAFFIVYVGQTERTPENYAKARQDAMTKFAAIHRMTDELYPDRIGLATSAGEARAIHAQGKLVAMIGIENGFVIGSDISLLKDYYTRGARYMTLVHNGHNDIGDSAQPRERLGDAEEEHGGLSDFGHQVVLEMNRLGMIVDISHVSRKTMLQAAKLSRAPVIASHSSVTGVADHPRNMNDEQLMALKENGGVIQIVAYDSYLGLVVEEKLKAISKVRQELGLTSPAAFRSLTEQQRADLTMRMDEIHATWPRSSVKDFVDHIDYAIGKIGIDHVGIASDFGGGGGVTGWNNVAETMNVTLELIERGYSEQEIDKVWGGNLLRVLEEVEAVAASLRLTPD